MKRLKYKCAIALAVVAHKNEYKFENTVCPKYGATDKQGFRVFPWAVPFLLTNVCPGADAKDEREILEARTGSVAESQPQDFDLESISKVFFSLWDRHLACTNSRQDACSAEYRYRCTENNWAQKVLYF